MLEVDVGGVLREIGNEVPFEFDKHNGIVTSERTNMPHTL
jgi:hypothetical protein